MVQVQLSARWHGHGASERDHPIRIGVAIPLRGPGGIFAPSCEAVTELCLRSLNDRGVLGRQVEVEVIDAGAPPAEVAAEISRLVGDGRIHALTGWHISSVRQHVAPETMGRIPYVYTSLYEGGEARDGVFCSGETPLHQIAPALRWLRDELGLRRWHLVGANYVWPRCSAAATLGFARELGLDIASRRFVPFGTADFTPVVRHIERSPAADGVLLFLVGQDAVAFNRAFAAHGLDERLVRFSPLMEENMLLASGRRATRNLYVSAGYFRTLATAGSMDLVGQYAEMFGSDAPPLNNQAESCYEGIMVLAGLMRTAQCVELDCLLAAGDGVGYDGPRGAVELRSGHLRQRIHLARADGYDFDVLASLR